MKKIAVIGQNSYIGTSFKKYMEQQKEDVQIIMAGARDSSWKKIDFSEIDVVLHAAAIVHKKEKPEMKNLYKEVNTEFPIEVAKKAKVCGVKQFVFLSTMAVYGNISEPISAKTKPLPITLYGKSKLEAERRLKKLSDKTFQVIVLRPPMVYGHDCTGNYQRLAKMSRKLCFFPKVKNKRSMIYIENLCECIRQALKAEDDSYMLICPQNTEYVNTTELVLNIRKANGKRTLLLPFGSRLIAFLAKKSGIFQKVFGNCCYRKTGEEEKYQVADFKESVRRAERGVPKKKKALMTATVASMIDLFNMDNIYTLQKMGYEVHVAANFKVGNVTSKERVELFRKELENAGVHTVHVPIPRSIGDIKNIVISCRQLRKLCMEEKYKLVHTQSPIGGVVTRVAAKKLRKYGTKVIYAAHGFHFFKGAPKKNWLLFYPIEKYFSKYTDVLITINREDYKRAQKFYAKRVCYVPGVGVDIEKFQTKPKNCEKINEELRKEFGISEQDYIVLSVGELSKRKNQETVIRAMAKISDTSVKYVLAGLGELEEADRQLIKELHLEERVILAGYRGDIADLLCMSDCFVFPSLQEGLPVSLMEAMAAGVPIVCSKIRGNTDLIEDCKEGRLVEANDISGFVKAITELKNEPQKAAKYAQNAEEKVKGFGTEKVREIMRVIYEN